MGPENSNATYVAYIDGKPVEVPLKPVQLTVAHLENGEIVPDTQDFSTGWSSAADAPENVTAAAMAWKGATITMKVTEATGRIERFIAALELDIAVHFAKVLEPVMVHRYLHTKKKRTRRKYEKRILTWYRGRCCRNGTV